MPPSSCFNEAFCCTFIQYLSFYSLSLSFIQYLSQYFVEFYWEVSEQHFAFNFLNHNIKRHSSSSSVWYYYGTLGKSAKTVSIKTFLNFSKPQNKNSWYSKIPDRKASDCDVFNLSFAFLSVHTNKNSTTSCTSTKLKRIGKVFRADGLSMRMLMCF